MDNHINGEICIKRVYKTGIYEKFYNFFFFFKYTQLPTVGNLRVYTFTY